MSYTKTVNGVTVTTIRLNGCTPVKSVVYTYDSGTGYVLTNGINGDSLVSYNGKSITYDAVGNPVNYLGNTLTWNGRTLTKYVSADGKITVTYTYDLDGVRTGKTVTEKVGTGASAYTKTTEYSYTYEGTTLLYEKRVCSESSSRNVTVYELYYTYSGLETLAKIDYSVTTTENGQSNTVSGIYSVVTNSRGDIERIIGSTGTVCAEYVYDAWGNLLETKALTASGTIGSTIADVNPVRYRGYYFDEETGLYYCIARYYDAEVGRWISPEPNAYDGLYDSGAGLECYNLFTYCGNKPVVMFDYSGEFVLSTFLIGLGIGFVIGVGAQYISDVVVNVIDGKQLKDVFKPRSTVVDYFAAGLSGAISSTGIGTGWAVFANALIADVTYFADCSIEGQQPDPLECVLATGSGMLAGFVGGSGVDLSKQKGIIETSKQYLKNATSAKKIMLYTSKIKNANKVFFAGVSRAFLSILSGNTLNYYSNSTINKLETFADYCINRYRKEY